MFKRGFTYVGVSEYREGLSLEKCIKDDDTALYQAKHRGRNRVVIFGENQ